MNNLEIDNLLQDLNSKPGHLEKIEWWVGKDKIITTRISEYLGKYSTSTILPEGATNFLQLCSLLLLEREEEMVDVIRNICIHNPETTRKFIQSLIESPFYYHRMAVPRIIVDMDAKDILLQCFRDQSGIVIKQAAMSLSQYKVLPLGEDELMGIAMDLNNHQYDYVQCTVPDILIHLKEKTFLVSEVCLSPSWRKRLAIATKISFFDKQNKATIFSLLHKDKEEGIRAALVGHLTEVDNMREYTEIFIKDPSEKVRALTVRAIGGLGDSQYQDILGKACEDPSWLVRKELLCIHNENIYETISLPLITSLPSNHDWRVKVEILESILHLSQKNSALIRRCLSGILFEYLADKVFVIREKTSSVIKSLVENVLTEDWAEEWKDKIRNILESPNYLLRISIAPVCVPFDRLFNTSFVPVLLQDKVPNVRLKVLENLEDVAAYKELVEAMEKDEYIEKEIKRLFS
ncbi:Protein phosphatase 2A scaffold subunit [Nosema granulosis]|uniref:Protein phosphatase 2A scaffold subunit n=1 Tax=Nosema granulosis TaxID=83296 RepID=A0A9P6KZJ1_9MICR|nr:Protein phosphatase 2A scaffold subunit [Nosema granulosis]